MSLKRNFLWVLLIFNAVFVGSGAVQLFQRIDEGLPCGWNAFALACSILAVAVVATVLEFGGIDRDYRDY